MRDLTVDTETALIAEGRLAPPMACASWADSSGAGLLDPDRGLDLVRDALRDSGTRLVGHHMPYDLGVCAQRDPSLLPLIHSALDADRIVCTKVNSQIQLVAGVHNQPAHSLADEARRWLDVQVGGKGGDGWRLHYRKLIGIPVTDWPADARDYAVTDAMLTRDVWEAQQRRPVPNLDEQMRSAWALHTMGAWGFRIDPCAARELDAKLRPPVEAARAQLTAWGLLREDGTKDLKLIKALVTRAYNGAPPTTDKGNVQTSEEVLSESGNVQLMKLASIATAEKELAAFLPFLLRGAESGLPVCPEWNNLVRSGRTSCRKPGAQQLPRRAGVRECIVPRKGNLFFGADYDTAELRSLAQNIYWYMGKEGALMRALRAGLDPHLQMGAAIAGVSYDKIAAAYAAGEAWAKDARSLAKAPGFGFPGGLGARSFVDFAKGYGFTLTLDRAKELKRLWLQTYPLMNDYFAMVGSWTGAGNTTITQPWSGRLRADTGYTDGCNTLFQGLTADYAKMALYRVTRAQLTDTSSALYGSRLVVFVHDELVGECPAEQAPEAGEELARIMRECAQEVCPDVPHGADPYLMSRWTKSAKTRRDKRGRLCL
jgi:DNA polymerase I